MNGLRQSLLMYWMLRWVGRFEAEELRREGVLLRLYG